ncbi:MAG: PDGLE domain-containing protein [Candidatus Saganbacteria bacterium]|nr:PDGLE domain-containing protein [Candidatus Saganbacteria bacterium]
MKKIFWFSIAIAMLAAFFASTFPDGLDFTAEKLGFGKLAVERSSIMTRYCFPFIGSGIISTFIAGACGVVLTAGIFYFAGMYFRRINQR